MKTKALFLGIALAAVVAVQAQTNPVYSMNVVGYAKLSLPSGFSMICNPLNTTNNTIGALIPTFPLGGNLYKFTGVGFDIATYLPTGWDKPNLTLAPGEGCFVLPGSATTLIFSGEVLQGALTNAIPAGFSTQASKVPQGAGIDALGLTNPGLGDNVYKFNGVGYDIYTYLPGQWMKGPTPSTPQIAVGESFFYNASGPLAWVRNFSAN